MSKRDNPYASPEEISSPGDAEREQPWRSRVIFLISMFLLFALAFYLGIAMQWAYSPYVRSIVGIQWLKGTFVFASVFIGVWTAICGSLSLLVKHIKPVHYYLLAFPFAIAFFMSCWFWNAFFFI